MNHCTFNLNTSDLIAILAILISCLSARYANLSLRENKKANKISLLAHIKEIYDAFFDLKMHMLGKSEFAELGDVSKFYYPSRNAHLYLPKSTASDISKYYEACFWIAGIHRRNKGITEEGMNKIDTHLEVEQKLSKSIDEELTHLIQSINS